MGLQKLPQDKTNKTRQNKIERDTVVRRYTLVAMFGVAQSEGTDEGLPKDTTNLDKTRKEKTRQDTTRQNNMERDTVVRRYILVAVFGVSQRERTDDGLPKDTTILDKAGKDKTRQDKTIRPL